MLFFRLSFTAVAFAYTKRVGERDHCQDGKCKIKFMLVVSADQTTYWMHNGMKQIVVSNHEGKYIRQKKPIKTDYL